MSSKVSYQTNWFKGLLLWIVERFPPVNILASTVLFFVIYSFVCLTLDQGPAVGIKEVFAALAVCSFMLLLRISDEFKDFNLDHKLHPERVLQKGYISLKTLAYMATLCILLQVLFNLKYNSPVNIFWLASINWLFLMHNEFFIKDWLKKHSFLYLLSHMTIMPLITAWVLSVYNVPIMTSTLVISVIFIGSILFELSRKTRGLDEDPRLESYPQKIGFKWHACLLVALTALLIFTYQLMLIKFNINSQVNYVLTIGAACIFALSSIYTAISPKKLSRKILEGNYSLLMLTLYGHFIYSMFNSFTT